MISTHIFTLYKPSFCYFYFFLRRSGCCDHSWQKRTHWAGCTIQHLYLAFGQEFRMSSVTLYWLLCPNPCGIHIPGLGEDRFLPTPAQDVSAIALSSALLGAWSSALHGLTPGHLRPGDHRGDMERLQEGVLWTTGTVNTMSSLLESVLEHTRVVYFSFTNCKHFKSWLSFLRAAAGTHPSRFKHTPPCPSWVQVTLLRLPSTPVLREG